MNSREFFYLTAEMRAAQRAYFETRDRKIFLKCRALEGELDREIARVKMILDSENQDRQTTI